MVSVARPLVATATSWTSRPAGDASPSTVMSTASHRLGRTALTSLALTVPRYANVPAASSRLAAPANARSGDTATVVDVVGAAVVTVVAGGPASLSPEPAPATTMAPAPSTTTIPTATSTPTSARPRRDPWARCLGGPGPTVGGW